MAARKGAPAATTGAPDDDEILDDEVLDDSSIGLDELDRIQIAERDERLGERPSLDELAQQYRFATQVAKDALANQTMIRTELVARLREAGVVGFSL
jgi:hypothetical protein